MIAFINFYGIHCSHDIMRFKAKKSIKIMLTRVEHYLNFGNEIRKPNVIKENTYVKIPLLFLFKNIFFLPHFPNSILTKSIN